MEQAEKPGPSARPGTPPRSCGAVRSSLPLIRKPTRTGLGATFELPDPAPALHLGAGDEPEAPAAAADRLATHEATKEPLPDGVSADPQRGRRLVHGEQVSFLHGLTVLSAR